MHQVNTEIWTLNLVARKTLTKISKLKQEGHDGPGSLTLIIQCTAMQNTSRQVF